VARVREHDLVLQARERGGGQRVRAARRRDHEVGVLERVAERGIALEDALAVFEQIEHHCDAVSSAFVTLFMTGVWQPFERAGMPEERWAEINAAITSLRPLAADALEAIFDQRMGVQIEAAFGELTRRLARPDTEG